MSNLGRAAAQGVTRTVLGWATMSADMAHQQLAAQLLRHFATSASEVARGLANDSLYINCSVTV